MLLPLVVLFLPVFDFFALSVAAPAVQHDLTGADRGAELVLAAFSLAYATSLLAGGALGDRFGPRPLIAAGICGYLLACLFCATAPNVEFFLAARLLQGVSAAAMVAQGFVLIAGSYAAMAATLGAAAALGQLLGGLPTTWRWLFVLEIAIGLIIALHRPVVGHPSNSAPVDPNSIVLGVLLPLSVLIPLAWLRLTGGGSAWVLATALTAIPIGVGYHRRLQAMAGRRRHLVFTGWRPVLAAAGTAVVYAGQALLLFAVSLRPYTPTLIAYGVSFALVSLLPLPRQSWPAGPVLAGTGLTLLLAGTTPLIPLTLTGAAMGLMLPRLTSIALIGSAPGALSQAAVTIATMQQFAAATALTVAGRLLSPGP